MLKQYDPQTAKETILKRTPPDEFPVSQRVLHSIAQLFGEELMPDQAVARILGDVRANGDAALQKWTLTLDGMDLKPAPVPFGSFQKPGDGACRASALQSRPVGRLDTA